MNRDGAEILSLRDEWLPREIYGEVEYQRRVQELKRKRYYGEGPDDKAGILRYTKATDEIFDLGDIPTPSNERELSWLLSFYWHIDQACNSLPELAEHLTEGERPTDQLLATLTQKYRNGLTNGLQGASWDPELLLSLGITN